MSFLGPFAVRVLMSVGDAGQSGVPATIGSIAASMREPVVRVDQAVRSVCQLGYLTAWVPAGATAPEGVALRTTALGERTCRDTVRMRAAMQAQEQSRVEGRPATGQIPLVELGRMLAEGWEQGQDERNASLARSQAGWLVGDAERDEALRDLSQAYADNRIDLGEHDRRTALVLAARTRGEVAVALTALPVDRPDAHALPQELAVVARALAYGRVAFIAIVVAFFVLIAAIIAAAALS